MVSLNISNDSITPTFLHYLNRKRSSLLPDVEFVNGKGLSATTVTDMSDDKDKLNGGCTVPDT